MKKTYSLLKIMILLVFNQLLIGVCVFFVLKLNGYFEEHLTVTDLHFISFGYVRLLWLIIPILAVEMYLLYRYNKNVVRVLRHSPSSTFFPFVSSWKMALKLCSINLAFCALVFTICQPVKGEKSVKSPIKNAELILVMDISSSMNVKDLSVDESRLSIAKRAMSELVNNLDGERVGIVVFAQQAHTYLPLTTDYSMVQTFLNAIQTSMMTNQGTNLHNAIMATDQLFIAPDATRTILLVTDAESHEGKLKNVVNYVHKKAINSSILALGTLNGGLIPHNIHKPEFGYKLNAQGERIISRLNYAMLNQLSTALNATLIVPKDAYPDLTNFLIQLRKNEKLGNAEIEIQAKRNLFHVPFLVFLTAILTMIVSSTSLNLKKLTHFNLFKHSK